MAVPLDYVPDAAFPTDNDWGIPSLMIERQSLLLELPFTRWGTLRRGRKVGGTIHFYTDDYKFSGLWRRPDRVLTAAPSCVIEPNFSTSDAYPAAAALWAIYRKRWLARYWQEAGVRVTVDLAVSERHRHLSLLGVPGGWRSYSTTVNATDEAERALAADYAQAVERAGHDDILFTVYGGGKSTEMLCRERGWVWVHRSLGG